MRSAEVLIVGGGPAGLAAAIALRQQGIECIVVEAQSPGIDKACGEGLMPGTLLALADLGIDISPSEGCSFRGIRFANSRDRVDASFPAGRGIGLRRPLLHARLLERASELGAELLWNSRVTLPRQSVAFGKPAECATISGETVRFKWLIGADGQSSIVRRWAGLGRVSKETERFGFRRHYGIKPWSDFVEIHWARQSQIYVTPVSTGSVCIVFMTHDAKGGRQDFLVDFPELAQRLAGAPMLSPQRGAISASRTLAKVATNSVALVGDASGSADAITGEGLAMSFHQALALAESIEKGSLCGYRDAHKQIARLPHSMARLMLLLDRWPRLEARALRTLAADPTLFEDMLNIHAGRESLFRFALRRGPEMGLGLLARPQDA